MNRRYFSGTILPSEKSDNTSVHSESFKELQLGELSRQNGSLNHPCPFCHKTFETSRGLTIHITRSHKDIPKPISIPNPNKTWCEENHREFVKLVRKGYTDVDIAKALNKTSKQIKNHRYD